MTFLNPILKRRAALVIMMLLAAIPAVRGQHTLAVVGGGGMTNCRLYPSQERRVTWGVVSGGLSWRYYSAPRFVGGVGADLEFIQRGFSYSPDAYRYEDKADYHYYSRLYNTVSLPVVWQPHVYMFNNHLRIYLEAMLNLEYNISATYKNELTGTEGVYNMVNYRDNRFGYGLAGGGGIDLLFGRFEAGVRVRYYFGLSDIMRNRNKYYDNGLDDPGENPFYYTPLRSPVDNLMISIKVGFRFNKGGFNEWNIKREKRDKNAEVFKFSLD